MKPLALLALVSATAFAGAPQSKKVATLILPMDKGSESLVLKIEGYADEALGEFDGFKVLTTDQLFGVAPDEEAAASLKRAEQGFAESKTAFDETKNWEDAEKKLRSTLKEYGKAAPALKKCGNLCEAEAMFAAVLQARGDTEEAKITLLDLLALSPSHELDRKRYLQNFLSLKAQVATSRNAQLRGGLTINTRPQGARVFINGEAHGFSPTTVTALPIGKTLVRVERPGFKQFGAIVEVTPDDQDLTWDLTATSGYAAYDALMDKLAGEAMKDKGGSAMTSVGNSLKLDRAVIGVLRKLESGTLELSMGFFDLKTGKRISYKRATFQEDEYGQLKGEVGRMVNHLVNDNESDGASSKSGDPLDHKFGTEDWASEDKGGKRNSREKKSSGGDPLDSASGTEDW